MTRNRQELLSIGEVAQICKVSVKTLRHYDKVGLLKPDKIDSESNYRYYSRQKMQMIPIIKYYKVLGFKLHEIERLLPRNDLDDLIGNFHRSLDELDEEIAELFKKRQGISDWLQLIEDGMGMLASGRQDAEIWLRDVPLCPCAHMHQEVDPAKDFSEVVVNIDFVNMGEVTDIFASGPLIIGFASYGERLEDQMHSIELFIPVCGGISSERVCSFGGFRAVTSIHKGSYDEIGAAYSRALEWSSAHGIILQGCSYEKYIIDPWSILDENQYVTEIMLPVK